MAKFHDQLKIMEAQKNAEEIWNNIFDAAPILDPNAPLGLYQKDKNYLPILND